MARKWFEVHDNLIGLASWLDHEYGGYFTDVAQCIYFFGKPWKWDREYGLWLLWKGTADPDIRDRIIEAVDENETTVETILAELEEENAAHG